MLERQIRSYMSERGSVFRALVFDSVDSTNTVLAGLAREGAEEYTAVIAGAQTAGRGRGEHKFFSPAGCGVYFSLLLRPRIPAEAAAKLVTPACAVAAAEAIENVSGETAGIKWVNDVFLRGRKVCGILTEAAPDGRGGLAWDRNKRNAASGRISARDRLHGRLRVSLRRTGGRRRKTGRGDHRPAHSALQGHARTRLPRRIRTAHDAPGQGGNAARRRASARDRA